MLLEGFRSLVDHTHRLLAVRGHPGVRPAHGFTLQAIGAGATASEVGNRLGVSKQAAAKTLSALEAEGYVSRSTDPEDARRRTIVLTPHGHDLLRESERAFDEALGAWRDTIGDERVGTLVEALVELDLPAAHRLDLGAWSR